MFDMAANMYGMYPNIYNNQIAMNDLSGIDLYNPTSMYTDPMLSMNGSIFNPMMGGMYPTMGMPGGGYQDYYQSYEKYQDFMIDSQVRQQQKIRNAGLQLNSSQEGVQEQAKLLHDKIIRNEQQQILQAYARYKESVRSMYGDASDEQISNRANALYAQMNGGKTVIDDLRENGRDSFTQGLLQTMTLGFADKKTAEENVSELTGQPVGRKEKLMKLAGNVTGGALIGGVTLLGANQLFKITKFCAKSRTAWGIVAGAIAGLTATLMTSK